MIRRAAPEELRWVASCWLRSFASSDKALAHTPKDDTHTRACMTCGRHTLLVKRSGDGMLQPQCGQEYWAGQRALIGRLCAISNVSVAQAEDGLLDGFVVRAESAPVLHYVYVRQSARGQGVARKLAADLAGKAVRFTHRSRGLLPAKVPKGWLYTEYALLEVL